MQANALVHREVRVVDERLVRAPTSPPQHGGVWPRRPPSGIRWTPFLRVQPTVVPARRRERSGGRPSPARAAGTRPGASEGAGTSPTFPPPSVRTLRTLTTIERECTPHMQHSKKSEDVCCAEKTASSLPRSQHHRVVFYRVFL